MTSDKNVIVTYGKILFPKLKFLTYPETQKLNHNSHSICGSSCSSPGLFIQPVALSLMVFFLRTVHEHTEDQRSQQ